jgi:putative ABC transport system permease protein
MRRHPFYAFINIFGLALGSACCVIITLFVRDEWSYDRFHTKGDRIYRIALFEHYEDHDFLNVETPFTFASLFENNIPEVEEAIRIVGVRDRIQHGNEIQIDRIFMADPELFEMFDFPLVRGEPAQVLRSVNSIVLSQDAARRWFGEADPVGLTLSLHMRDQAIDFIVSGIAFNTPKNSSIRFDYLIPIENAKNRWEERELRNPYNVFAETFILLPENYDIAELQAKTPDLMRQLLGETYIEGAYVPGFQGLTDIHLDTDYPSGGQPTSDPAYSYILAIIAVFVLLIACINFVTFTLSRSAERIKEVGVRKTLGALRRQLIGQFWGEAIWFSLFGLALGLIFAYLAMPEFNALVEKELVLRFDAFFVFALVGLIVSVGLMAGSYPALFLSRYQPMEVLKGHFTMGEANTLRKGLTVVQFALAILLIIATFVMQDQFRFLQEKNLGFDREQVVNLPTGLPRAEGMEVLERFRNEVAGRDAIAGVTASLFTFGEPWISAGYETNDGVYREFRLNLVDFDFLKTLDIPVIAGRGFNRATSSDRREAVIVNRAFAELHGWENPVGKQLPGAGFPAHRIIGMVDDFNYASLHSKVEPLALALTPLPLYDGLGDMGYFAAPQPKLLVRLKAGNVAEGLKIIEAAWKKVTPNLPFNYTFVDDMVQRQYGQEQRLGTFVAYATFLVVVIACLGLFGLASLMAVKRTKEIGIRKVMGATAGDIIALFVRDFARLVGLAFVLATPVAFVVMRHWLEDFAYATVLKVSTFGLAGCLAIAVALLTVSYQSIRAARSNPVDALRYE